MGHVQDRWHTTKTDPATGKQHRVRTPLYVTGQRYKVRYVDTDGIERSKMFPDRCKREADNFLVEIEAAKREGRFLDPRAGKISFKAQAENWLKGQSNDASTRGALRSRLDSRIYPYFASRPLASITPSTIRDWLGVLDDANYSQNYRTVLFTIVSSVLDSAVEDRRIAENACKARTIKRPTSPASRIVIWPRENLDAVHDGLPDRFRLVTTLGAGCGLRQGEILGLAVDDVDIDAMQITVRRQLRIVHRQLVFAPPKGGKTRVVPLSRGVGQRLTAHADTWPPSMTTLPWLDSEGQPHTANLLVTDEHGRIRSGDLFNKVIWQGAFRTAGLTYRPRADGMHALRHFYASVLLSEGVSIKELAAYLGHADPGFTLRTYTHLVPSSFQRARAALDGVFATIPDGLTTA